METAQIVVFKLNDHDFGVDIKKVIEILNYEPVRPVPDVPDYVEGILNVRGTIYPVFNLRKRLHIPALEDPTNSKIILMHLEGYKVGFLVDNVAEILNIGDLEMEHTPEVLDKKGTECIEGIVKQENRMVFVLKAKMLVSENEDLFVQGVSDEDNSSSNSEQR